jgi:hypothetical protein
LAGIGLFKAGATDIEMRRNQDNEYGASLSVEPYVRWRAAPKIWLVAGGEFVPLTGYAWYGANLGATFSF